VSLALVNEINSLNSPTELAVGRPANMPVPGPVTFEIPAVCLEPKP
jgi:hypothetical protein